MPWNQLPAVAALLPSPAKSLWRRKLVLEIQAFSEHDFRGCFTVWKPHAEQCVVSGGYYVNVIISLVKWTIQFSV
jgi:hypothetical protein